MLVLVTNIQLWINICGNKYFWMKKKKKKKDCLLFLCVFDNAYNTFMT